MLIIALGGLALLVEIFLVQVGTVDDRFLIAVQERGAAHDDGGFAPRRFTDFAFDFAGFALDEHRIDKILEVFHATGRVDAFEDG